LQQRTQRKRHALPDERCNALEHRPAKSPQILGVGTTGTFGGMVLRPLRIGLAKDARRILASPTKNALHRAPWRDRTGSLRAM